MQQIEGLTQQQLNDIWNAIGTDNDKNNAIKITDDIVEQVMKFNVHKKTVFVTRKQGQDWHETPSIGQNLQK